jgi:hypothetical protein
MFVAVVDICEAELRDDRHEKEKNTKRKKESREHAHTPTSASCGCATCRPASLRPVPPRQPAPPTQPRKKAEAFLHEYLMTRFFDEVLNGARFDASTLESLFTDMVLVHGALENPAARLVGREALRAFLQRLRRALPEAQFALEDVGGEGDFVLADWKARVCSSCLRCCRIACGPATEETLLLAGACLVRPPSSRPMTPAWFSLSAPPPGTGRVRQPEVPRNLVLLVSVIPGNALSSSCLIGHMRQMARSRRLLCTILLYTGKEKEKKKCTFSVASISEEPVWFPVRAGGARWRCGE